MSESFKLGDLVWAKMKGFSPWPGRVAIPTPELKLPKKAMNVQCIYFFGTNNYAWIEDNNIKPYQEYKEQLIKSCKTTAFKEAVLQIEEFIVNPEKFPDLDDHVRNTEEDFDKLKDVMEEDESQEEKAADEEEAGPASAEPTTSKKKGSTPKVKPIKRSSSAGTKATPRKKSKVPRSYTDIDANEKPSMLNHSFSKKSSLLHRPSNILRPASTRSSTRVIRAPPGAAVAPSAADRAPKRSHSKPPSHGKRQSHGKPQSHAKPQSARNTRSSRARAFIK